MTQETASTTSAPQPLRRRLIIWLLLGLVLLAGLWVRSIHLADWDSHAQLHPDERFLIHTVYQLRVPASFEDYLTTSCPQPVPEPSSVSEDPSRLDEPSLRSGCSTLNPRNYNWSRSFVYGSLPLSLTRIAAEQLQQTDLRGVTLVGRQLSTLADLLALLMIYLTGARLFGRRAALLAAALYAFTVLGIQQSHFFTTDTFAAFFSMLALYWSVRLAQSGRGWAAFGCALAIGLGIGAATASKINLAALALLPLLASLQWAWRTRDELSDDWGQAVRRAIPPLALAGLATLITFRLANPDAFRGPGLLNILPDQRFLESINSVRGLVSGELDYPPSHQWTARPAWLFPWYNMVLWGMGLALGLTAWGAWLAAAWRLLRRREGQLLLLVVWIGLYFLWQGQQFAKTLRYMLPIYGALVILAGWGLDRLLLWARARLAQSARGGSRARGSALGIAGYGLAAAVLLATFLWGLGFSRIYTRPHSRVAAADWLRSHVTTDKVLTNEMWDDALPNTGEYQQLQTHPYAEDTPQKVRQLVETLAQADYVTLTSNRIYGSVSRLPMRYPATNRYYGELFRCAKEPGCPLGFELAADFSSYPSFFGMPIPDQFLAEEAFSVYDHPRVLIFKKREDFSAARAYQLLTQGIVWEEIYRLRPIEATEAPTALRLTPAQWADQQDAGTWATLFGPANGAFALLKWALLLELLGLATFGLLFALRLPLPDRGLSLARPLGLLLVAYPAWALASLHIVSFSRTALLALALALLVAGGLALYSRRRQLRVFAHERRQALLASQSIYLIALLIFLAIRYLNPDLWHPSLGGEKPMELAFLTATIKSTSFPPYDPWFVGGYINYYYWGFVLIGAPLKLLGIDPAIGFNLALPTLAGWTALGAWGVIYNLVSRIRAGQYDLQRWRLLERRAILAGCAAALFLVLCGNLAQAVLFTNGLRMLGNPQLSADTYFKQGLWLENEPGNPLRQVAGGLGQVLQGEQLPFRLEWPYWNATRVIPGAVSEFPFFSFLYGDLHAHTIALPLTLAALILMAAVLRGAGAPGAAGVARRDLRSSIAPVLLLALVVGALQATNTWDYPTYLLLSLAAIGAASLAQQPAPGRHPLLRFALLSALLVLGSMLLFWPWSSSFASAYSKIQRIQPAERMGLRELLAIYGLWLFVLVSYGALLIRRAVEPSLRRLLGPGCLVWLLAVWLVGGSALLALLPLLLIGAWLLYGALAGLLPRRHLAPLGLAMAGLLLLAGTELFTLAGAGRMNTVFKFGYQIWTLWALASALALLALPGAQSGAAGYVSPRMRSVWQGALGLLLAAALLYPVTATPAKIHDRIAPDLPHTLDGSAFMQHASIIESGSRIQLADDLAAIRWLRANVVGTPAIAEAHLPSYRWGGRIATWTGLPTVLGWEVHERQQREAVNAGSIVDSRKAALQELYTGKDPARTLEILKRYGIEYIYVGPLERTTYGGDANATHFSSLTAGGSLTLAYSQGGVRIYRLAAPAPPLVLHQPANINPPPDSIAQRLMLPQPVDQLPALGEYADNTWLNNHQWGAILAWLLLWEGLGLLALPIAALIFARRGDSGWGWAKLIGLLIWGYLVWVPANLGLWWYSRQALLLGLAGLVLLDVAALWLLGRSTGAGDGSRPAAIAAGLRRLGDRLRRRRGAILASELVFLAVFAFWTLIRALNPDLWHAFFGGEKPFEFGLLNAILRSPTLPPYDPFYSGGIVNYYYYGLYLVSLPVKALGLDPAIAFNLIVPTIGALAAAGALAVTYALTGRLRWALAGVAALLFIGNLGGALALGESGGLCRVLQAVPSIGNTVLAPTDGSPGFCGITQQSGAGGGSFAQNLGWWFWGASRLISSSDLVTINEFPFWSLLFADLHPHLIALPIVVLAIALAWELAGGGRRRLAAADVHDFAAVALTPLVIGAIAISNSWDLPTYSLLLLLALLLRGLRLWQSRGELALRGWPPGEWRRLAGIVGWPLLGVGLLVLGLVLYLPFFGHYWAPVKGIGWVRPSLTTPVVGFLAIYGLLLFVTLGFGLLRWGMSRAQHVLLVVMCLTALALTGEVPQWLKEHTLLLLLVLQVLFLTWPSLRRSVPFVVQTLLLLLALATAVAAASIWPERGLALLLLAPLLILVGPIFRRDSSPTDQFTLLLAGLGVAVALGMELIFIRDHLAGGTSERMNTVFKFGYQVWVLLALAAAAALPRIVSAIRAPHRSHLVSLERGIVLGIGGLLLLASLVFTVAGPVSRIATRFPVETGLTLDGLAFMEQASYTPDVGGRTATIELAADAAAIEWMQKHLQGTPVVLQSQREFYRTYGVRIAANTGLPTVLGRLHADEQRPAEGVHQREKDIERIYSTTDPSEARRLLGRYRVNYVYIGPLERALYSKEALAKFRMLAGLEAVYEQGQSLLYAVDAQVWDQARRAVESRQSAANGEQRADDDRLALLEALLEENPGDVGTAFVLGQLYRDAGEHDRAAEALRKAAQANPQEVPLRHLLGDVLRDAGRIAEAEAVYREAIDIAPSASNISKLGQELLGWGDLEQAERVLNQALAADAGFPFPHYFLGELYLRRGDNDRARQEFEIFLRSTKEGDPYHDFALRKMSELQ